MPTTLERSAPSVSSRQAARFAVDVVDGSGREIAGQPVTAMFRFRDGSETTVLSVTDATGRTRFEDAPGVASVILASGRETVGPIEPTDNARFVIEM